MSAAEFSRDLVAASRYGVASLGAGVATGGCYLAATADLGVSVPVAAIIQGAVTALGSITAAVAFVMLFATIGRLKYGGLP